MQAVVSLVLMLEVYIPFDLYIFVFVPAVPLLFPWMISILSCKFIYFLRKNRRGGRVVLVVHDASVTRQQPVFFFFFLLHEGVRAWRSTLRFFLLHIHVYTNMGIILVYSKVLQRPLKRHDLYCLYNIIIASGNQNERPPPLIRLTALCVLAS